MSTESIYIDEKYTTQNASGIDWICVCFEVDLKDRSIKKREVSLYHDRATTISVQLIPLEDLEEVIRWVIHFERCNLPDVIDRYELLIREQ